jgi:dienelactone hydrolase
LLGLVLILGTQDFAFGTERKPLTHADSDIWNSATGVTLSPDGTHLAYVVRPGGEGDQDGTVVLTNLTTGTETRFPTGTRQPPAPPLPGETPPAEPPAPPPGGPSGPPTFSPDSKRLFVPLLPTKAEVKAAKDEKKPGVEPPAGGLAVIDVASAKVVERLPRVKSFRVVGSGAGHLLFTRDKPPEQPKDGKPAETAPAPKPAGEEPAAPQRRPRVGPFGFGGGKLGLPTRTAAGDLTVRNLADGKEATLSDVAEFDVSRDFATLVYCVSAKDPAGNGVFATDLTAAPGKPLAKGASWFARLTWDEQQKRLAFVVTDLPKEKEKEEPKAGEATPRPPVVTNTRVFLWQRGTDAASEILSPTTAGLPAGSGFVDRGGLGFSADGTKLAVATAPLPKPAPPPVKPEDAVALDIWHWKDDAIQPMQKVRAAADRTKSFRGVYLLDEKTFRQLSDADRDVSVPDAGDWGVASSDKPYRGQQWVSPSPRDYSLVNVRTGEAKPLVDAAVFGVLRSPAGGFAARFDGKAWLGTPIPAVGWKNLTGSLPVGFVNDEHDTPNAAPAWGFVNWLADGRHFVVGDKFDLWVLDAAGTEAPRNLTAGAGRAAGVRLRPRTFPAPDGPPERGLDLAKPVLLEADNLTTRDSGFYRLPPGGKPQLLVMSGRSYGPPAKAKSADVYLFTASTFADYPDYHVADADFRSIRRVTDINPRTKEFNWGTAELVGYATADGIPLQGILIKPQDFDPAKKYPMVVYIYERLSQGLHSFRLPTVGTSINPTYYASNGYLVLMPDIVYTTGSPGQSALKCVLPAIQAVADKGYLDATKVGIQGHSWGGYQIAYMVTQTNRFAAAAAGAPVSNMTSAYGGIRWGTGLPRQFQYEQTQSRIGKPLWDAPMKYIDNSPLFHADRVSTPLLMLHNDQDDAVPWYQGIEYYLALRRLGKEVYMLNYNGEFHGLRKKAAQRDYTVRMQQFFDHHLKGKPMPAWMADGVKYLDRDAEKDAVRKLFQK